LLRFVVAGKLGTYGMFLYTAEKNGVPLGIDSVPELSLSKGNMEIEMAP
jgi:hypothetical protein